MSPSTTIWPVVTGIDWCGEHAQGPMRSHDHHSQALGRSRENCVMVAETLTPTEHRALTALRKWCHRDSPRGAL